MGLSYLTIPAAHQIWQYIETGVHTYNGYYVQDPSWMASFCPTALTKSNRDRLRTSQSPYGPSGADADPQAAKERLALLQAELRAAQQGKARLAEQVQLPQQTLSGKDKGFLQERSHLQLRQRQTHQLLDAQRGIV